MFSRDAFGITADESPDLTPTIVGGLREKQTLLIVDNCEHVIVSVSRLLDKVLTACGGVRVLATSRAPLGLRGERIWRLRPLGADDSAVALFIERSGLSGDIDDATRADVVEVCRALDGLPLAIELAAARCDVVGVPDMVAQLNIRRGFLRSTGGVSGRSVDCFHRLAALAVAGVSGYNHRWLPPMSIPTTAVARYLNQWSLTSNE